MFKPRIIPVLLLKGNTLVKSKKFKDHRYIGDPINAVRIFNDLKADELAFFDILATKENRLISLEFVKNVGEEANMPFAVGGGIKSIEDIRKIIGAGAEKVIINSFAAENPDFILQASETFGSSTIVVCMDVKKNMLGENKVCLYNGEKYTSYSPVDFSKLMEEKGVGEIIVQSIEQDGMMNGYDINLIKEIAEAVSIPVIALGGAGNLNHMKQAYTEGYASALAAGSMFVFHGPKSGVLINYPEKSELLF
ncbi:MAG: imidazole glycerol phosphate synthase subunit HisF [Bacteroidetes bacterium]|nr:imidazole glycerol phosphate synthase subunit HisF [Bacteroidota bacterium]